MEITVEIKQALHIAGAIAREYSNISFGPPHLLKALLHKEVGLHQLLDQWDEDAGFIEEWAEVRLETYPKGKLRGEPGGDAELEQVLLEAENLSLTLGLHQLTVPAVLASLCTPGVGFTYEQLKTFPLSQQQVLDKARLAAPLHSLTGTNGVATTNASGQISAASVKQYCQDLTAPILAEEAETFTGREQALISIAEILCRKSKPNVLLVGESGVGKTALLRGLALAVKAGRIPARLQAMRLFSLDLNALLAGATYKGETEDRFRNLLKDLSQYELPVLFIDDIHQLFDKNMGLQGLISLLKSALAKRTILLIGTTLTDEYRKKLEPDSSLMRWCDVLTIEEPGISEATDIVAAAASALGKHHGVSVHTEVIREVVSLSKRYIKERRLPDAALDVLDRTMAALQFMHHMAPGLAASATEKLEALKADGAAPEAYHELYQWLLSSLNYLSLSYLDLELHPQETPVEAATLEGIITRLRILDADGPIQAEIGHIAATISKVCGIPAGKILSGERERLIRMEEHLQARVVGQDSAIKTLADAILESRSGLSRPGQPIGSFFLLGPTGTGKTELAKQLADFLFQSSSALIRFDMSEFKEEHAAALLYGAPPGYVGYEEGGLLVNKIRQQPYAVVLFDEIEKAHASVFDIFLQILDEGKIHDKLGRTGDFSNAVILFTSNIGSRYIVEEMQQKGTLPDQQALSTLMARHFRPEFLGRLSGIVPFAPIRKENVLKILKLQLTELEGLLQAQGIGLSISDAAADKLATDGYSPDYGARPLRSVVRSALKTPLSRMLIAGQLAAPDTVLADLDEAGEISLSCQPAPLAHV